MSRAAGDDRSRLLRALALSRRYHLFLAYCESPRAADQLVRAIAEELPPLREGEVTVVRLDPYEGRDSLAPLGDGELADRILIPLLSPPEERRAHGVIHIVDASRATPGDMEAWGILFALWNEKRNVLQQLGGEVVVLLPAGLDRLFATAAPDVWSIRSGEYVIGEEAITPGSQPAEEWEALGWYRAVPPLALFGGDLVVRPWLRDIVVDADEDDLVTPISRFDEDARLKAQYALRNAEHALGERRFSDAADMFRKVVYQSDGEAQWRALTGLVVALAAEDRAEEALASCDYATNLDHVPQQWPNQWLRADAYAHWCAGRLHAAATINARRVWGDHDYKSWVLLRIERGEIADAIRSDERYDPDADLGSCADFFFLVGSFQKAASILRISWLRHRALAALVELAQGNRSRSESLLSQRQPWIVSTQEPDTVGRLFAFRAYVYGLLQAEGHNPEGALTWFARARDHIAEWSRTGLDRRSLHRASLAVDLAHATLDPAPADAVLVARRLVERATLLLGPTAEDFVARVLAVEARRELARRLVGAGDPEAPLEAQRALDLARPLAGRGVPAWDAIVAATEREALTSPV